MEVTKTTVAIVTAACLTVGAAGSYLVTRGNGPTVAAEPVADVPDPGAASSQGVEQSEELVTDLPGSPVAPAVAPRAAAPVPRPAPAPVAPSRPPARNVAPAPPPPPPVLADNAFPAPAAVEPVRPAEPEPVRAAAPPEPPAPVYQDLVLASDSVIGLQVEGSVSSETARIEDTVSARVVRDVKVGDHIAIPAGSKVRGEVTLVERGGKLKERARLGVRFTSVVLADGTRVPIATETIYREGDAPARESATKIGGGAIGGAIIGGLLGGGKGAAIGSAIGGGAGSAAVMAGGRNPATLTSGSPVTIRLEQPATVTIEK